MLFLRNTLSIIFLFLVSGIFPAFLLKFLVHAVKSPLSETAVTHFLTLLLIIFILKLLFYFLDSKNKNKKWLDYTVPTQLNQLIPFALGVAYGIPRGIEQMNWND